MKYKVLKNTLGGKVTAGDVLEGSGTIQTLRKFFPRESLTRVPALKGETESGLVIKIVSGSLLKRPRNLHYKRTLPL